MEKQAKMTRVITNPQTTTTTMTDDKQCCIRQFKVTKQSILSTLLSNKVYDHMIHRMVVGVVIFAWATLDVVSHLVVACLKLLCTC